MAVVKANYVKRGTTERSRAKATIRYNQQRPGKHKEKRTRDLFGADGQLTRAQVYKMIDESAKNTFFYRIVISPDPAKEDAPRDMDLKELTIHAIASLEERIKTSIHFAAVVHADHAPHRHVHVLALINRKLSQNDLNALRARATQISALQRRIRERQSIRAITPKHRLSIKPHLAKKPLSRGVSVERKSEGHGAPPVKTGVSCPRGCGGYSQTMERLSSKIHKCPSCGIVVRRVGLDHEIQGPGLNLGQGLLPN